MKNGRSIDQILIKALHIKAYSDWQTGLKALTPLKQSIVKNKSGQFSQTIVKAQKNWLNYDFIQKHDVLTLISHKICFLYKIPSVHIHNAKSWENFLKTNFLFTPETNTFSEDARGQYVYYEYLQLQSQNIIFPSDDFISSEDFFTVIETLAHELAHAIIDERHRMLKGSLQKREEDWITK